MKEANIENLKKDTIVDLTPHVRAMKRAFEETGSWDSLEYDLLFFTYLEDELGNNDEPGLNGEQRFQELCETAMSGDLTLEECEELERLSFERLTPDEIREIEDLIAREYAPAKPYVIDIDLSDLQLIKSLIIGNWEVRLDA